MPVFRPSRSDINLSNFWNALNRNAPAEELSRLARVVEPSELAAIHRARELHAWQLPDGRRSAGAQSGANRCQPGPAVRIRHSGDGHPGCGRPGPCPSRSSGGAWTGQHRAFGRPREWRATCRRTTPRLRPYLPGGKRRPRAQCRSARSFSLPQVVSGTAGAIAEIGIGISAPSRCKVYCPATSCQRRSWSEILRISVCLFERLGPAGHGGSDRVRRCYG
jgi:hypothetical protein